MFINSMWENIFKKELDVACKQKDKYASKLETKTYVISEDNRDAPLLLDDASKSFVKKTAEYSLVNGRGKILPYKPIITGIAAFKVKRKNGQTEQACSIFVQKSLQQQISQFYITNCSNLELALFSR